MNEVAIKGSHRLGRRWQSGKDLEKKLDYYGEKENFANLWRIKRLPRDPEFYDSFKTLFYWILFFYWEKPVVSMALSWDLGGEWWHLDFLQLFEGYLYNG